MRVCVCVCVCACVCLCLGVRVWVGGFVYMCGRGLWCKCECSRGWGGGGTAVIALHVVTGGQLVGRCVFLGVGTFLLGVRVDVKMGLLAPRDLQAKL